jgi:hypothetical protein
MSSQRSWQGLDIRGYRCSGCLLLFVLLALPLSATTYYVDCNGANSNNGTSMSTPWQTIAKVNNSSFSPGDSVLFRAGCTWREQMTVPSSGSEGNPITFGAYGSGAAPQINASNLVTGWSQDSGSRYKAAFSAATPQVVLRNGTRLVADGSVPTVDGHWYWAANVLYLCCGDPTSLTVEAGTRNYGIRNLADYITIQNIDTRNANIAGTQYSAYSNAMHWISISGINAQNNYQTGVYISDDGSGNEISNITISGNTTNNNGEYGISIGTLSAPVSQISITGNISHDDVFRSDVLDGGAIKLYGPTITNVTVEKNLVYNAGSALAHYKGGSRVGYRTATGIYFDTVGSGMIARYNQIYNNNWAGIIVEVTNGAALYGNVVYANGTTGISIYNSAAGALNNLVYNNTVYGNAQGIAVWAASGLANQLTGNLVKNNISVNNTTNLLAQYGGENDGTDGSGNVYTYNSFGTEASNFIEWGNAKYLSTDAAFDTAYGSSTHSITTAPTFTNAAGGNFTLAVGSSAIDAGTNLGSTYQMSLDPRTSFPWGTLNQNSQGAGWEIGAFVFVQQAPPPPTSLSATVK